MIVLSSISSNLEGAFPDDVRFADGQQEQYEDTESFFGSEGMLYRSRDGLNLIKLFPTILSLCRKGSSV